MPIFRVNRAYDPALDVRDHSKLLSILNNDRPDGVLWPLLAARRAGKTWTLNALAHQLGDQQAAFLDLRLPFKEEVFFQQPASAGCLLLDEPGHCLKTDPQSLINRCYALKESRIKLLLAMTPGEWRQLSAADSSGRLVSQKDMLYLAPLTPTEAQRIAQRSQFSQQILPKLSAPWTRNPFLLELVFQTAEETPELADDVRNLLRTVIDRCEDTEHFYSKAILELGLTEQQQRVIRQVARRQPADSDECNLLARCGLLRKQGQTYVLADPVLDYYYPLPLRIHHISDIHVGPKSAERVDVKEKGNLGATLGQGAGSGPVRDSYLEHLHSLAAEGKAPHLLVISGDIGETGDPAQYQEIKAWLQDISRILAPHPRLEEDQPRILMVGGNHDVDWNQALGGTASQQRHIPFAEAFRDYPHPHLEIPPKDREPARITYPDLGVEVLLLGSAEFGGEVEEDPAKAELLATVERLRACIINKLLIFM